MSGETIFSDSGINDIEAGAELFSVLRVGHEELMFPQNKDLLVDIADFVNKYPDALPRIRQAMRKLPRGESPLVHVNRFVSLQNKRMEMKSALTSLEKEIMMYE
jgi:hypothetical protein